MASVESFRMKKVESVEKEASAGGRKSIYLYFLNYWQFYLPGWHQACRPYLAWIRSRMTLWTNPDAIFHHFWVVSDWWAGLDLKNFDRDSVQVGKAVFVLVIFYTHTQRKNVCTIRGVGNISEWLMIGQLRWWLDRCVCGVAGAEGGRAAPPRCQPGAVAALAAFSGAAAIAGLRRGIQCGMGRSWGGHGLSRNTDCPPLSTHLPTSATRPIEPPVWSPFGMNPFREQSEGVWLCGSTFLAAAGRKMAADLGVDGGTETTCFAPHPPPTFPAPNNFVMW